MIGKLILENNRWYIVRVEEGEWETYYELHPKDVQDIAEASLVFDNVQARFHNSTVDFSLFETWDEIGGETKITRYGKLTPTREDFVGEDSMDLVEIDTPKQTPKEKATQLVHRFYISLPNNGSFSGLNNVNSRWKEGKNCALICVDEIIDAIDWHEYETPNSQLEFWSEVKQQIKNIGA